MLSPITPAPMTTVFGRDDKIVTEGVITDSLRRARPARFSGFDLSRLLQRGLRRGARRHPSLHPISDRGVDDCKDFFGRLGEVGPNFSYFESGSVPLIPTGSDRSD